MTNLTEENNSHGFELQSIETINALRLQVEKYQHRQTGAMHYHLQADNDENVFLVALRTVPLDSTGVAHILEHTALCGSEKYPVRDPFFMMIRRSLNTFMNAFTSTDWTAYPFASLNKKDFNNLLDVYLDAVFFSRLHELDFAQEGHRLEFSEKENPNSELLYKGVVYNEMKGAMSSPNSVAWHTLSKYLFPSTTYHYNSGGEPDHIPDLSYQQLKEFYQTHYHPSNAVFMTYGNIPASEHQQKFEQQVLKHFSRLDRKIAVADEKRYHAPVAVEEAYAIENNEQETSSDKDLTTNKSHLVLAWLLGPSIDLEQQLKAQLLSNVLLDNSASPLMHALETTELGQSPSNLCGLEDSNKEMSFICGLEGAARESAADFEQMVLKVLEEVAEKGVDKQLLDAVLHQLELSQREIGGDHYPFGLQLILTGLSTAIHRGDVAASIDLDRVLEKIRTEVEQPDFIQKLVKELLLNNPHRIRLSMYPDTEISERKQAAEKSRLAAIKSSLSDQDKQFIINQAKALDERQNQQDDFSILPKVGLDDVAKEITIPLAAEVIANQKKLSYYHQPTNGLVYQQIIINLPNLDEESHWLLPLFSHCMTELGCDNKSYMQTQLWQSSISGGISAHTSFRSDLQSEQKLHGYFVLSSKALHHNFEAMNELLKKTLETVRFDETDKILEIVSQLKTRKEHSITGSGHQLAMLAASSGMSPLLKIYHQTQGLAGTSNIKKLHKSLTDSEQNIEKLCEQFGRILDLLKNSAKQFLLITEKNNSEQQIDFIHSFWSEPQYTSEESEPLSLEENRMQLKQAWITSTQVNFCARSDPTVTAGHEDAAKLMVLGQFLKNGYLHRNIREQGGAYGGGATQDNANACFKFFSYRDPRLSETLEDFTQSITWLKENKHDQQALEEAILGVIGSLDKPGSPAGEAKKAFYNQLYGRDLKQQQELRAKVLKVSLNDLIELADKYFIHDLASEAVITEAANESLCRQLEMEINRI